MSGNLFLSELMFSVISTVALLTMIEFIRYKDGVLRKIMICFFAIEVFVYASSGLYFWGVVNGFEMTIDVFRVIVLAPKTICMMVLFVYLKYKRKKNRR